MLRKHLLCLLMLCILTTTTLLAVCGGVKKTEPAKQEKLVMYSAVNAEYMNKVAAEFEKDTGIKVETERLSAGELVARVRAEKNAPKASVLHGGSADSYIQLKEEGLLERYSSPQASAIPATMKDPAGYWTGIYIGYIGFMSNQKLLVAKGIPAPSGWNDLLRPELKGQVVITDPATAGSAYTVLATLVQMNGEEAAMQFMKNLHAQVKEYPKSSDSAAQMVGTGTAIVGVAFMQDAIRRREQGLPDIVITMPKEGTGYEIGAVGIVKGAPGQDAARKFVDWALSKKAQEIGQSVGSYQYPTLPAAKSSAATAAFRDTTKLVIYDFNWAGKNRKQLIDKWNALTK